MDEDTACNAFIHVRTQNCILTTRTIMKNSNPNWQAKLYFPIFMPTYNDKIMMRLWHSGGKDVFLANVPELPGPEDNLNVSRLMSVSKMPAYWINLYGIAPEDRGRGINVQHVSSFMGRVLMSLHLVQNDRPQFMSGFG